MDNKIYKLNKLLNSFPWNCIVNNKIADPNNIKNWQKYKVLTPKQFITLKTGCCWDFCNFLQYYWPKHYLYLFKLYFIQAEDESNHTWFCFFYNNNVYVFESAWKKYCGIFKFNNEEEMLNKYINQFFNDAEYEKYNLIKYKIYTYKSIDSVLPDDFLNNIYNNGKLIKNGIYKVINNDAI